MAEDRDLNQCDDLVPDVQPVLDPPPPYCGPGGGPSLRAVDNSPGLAWLKEVSDNQKTGLGASANCDPMLAGKIVADSGRTDVAYQYSRALRGCDEAVMDLFRDIVVIADDSNVYRVPIIWATQEKAVAAVLQPNVRKDDSGVVDRIKLPILAVHSNTFTFAKDRYVYHKATNWLRDNGKPGMTVPEMGRERATVFGVARGIPVDIGYTLYAWTMFKEDMNQIVEQVMQKIAPMGYIRVRGVHWEVGVRFESASNNETAEPGDKNIRVVKWQFNMTAQTYIPQPVIRRKAVLKIRVDVADGLGEAGKTVARLEEAVEGFEC